MNSSLASGELFGSFAQNVAALIMDLLERIFGAGIAVPFFNGISFAHVSASGVILALVLLFDGIVFGVLRWTTRRERAKNEPATLWRSMVEAFSSPLHVAVWIYGVYFALIPLLMGWEGEEAARLHWVLAKLLDVAVLALVVWLFFRLTRFFEARLLQWTARSESKLDDLLVPLVAKFLRVIVPVIAIILTLPALDLPPEYEGMLSKASSILIIGAVAWIMFQVVQLGERVVLSHFDISAADNLRARTVYTQVTVLKKTVYVIIGVFAIASVLMLFEEVRRFGTSILASAGIAGIIIGFAAQKTLANLFAGFQLAMTQPIRIDDVVIVENEWGRIEEITLTYVVVRIWDLRRLIMPISHFIEQPFQNWTRVSADILGTVMLYTDYTLPIEPLRQELRRIVEQSPLWDKKVCGLQVTDATEKTVQLRALVSATDASKAWDLRCLVREQLLGFIQSNYPDSLPKVRAELGNGAEVDPIAAAHS